MPPHVFDDPQPAPRAEPLAVESGRRAKLGEIRESRPLPLFEHELPILDEHVFLPLERLAAADGGRGESGHVVDEPDVLLVHRQRHRRDDVLRHENGSTRPAADSRPRR